MNLPTPDSAEAVNGPTLSEVLDAVALEVDRAIAKHGPWPNSCHHGHSVLLEEVEELWAEIKADKGRLGPAKREAIQVAVVAVRYVMELCAADPVAVMTHEDGERIRERQNKRDAESNERFSKLRFQGFDSPNPSIHQGKSAADRIPASEPLPAVAQKLCNHCDARPATENDGLCNHCRPF